jgi:hypothetical protein
MSDPAEKLKNHTRNLPCFSCIVRVSCIELSTTGHIMCKDCCDKWREWHTKKELIINEGYFTFSHWSNIITSVIEEVLESEKRNFDGR